MNINLKILSHGFDFKKCWIGPVLTTDPEQKLMVLAMTRLDINGSDVFEGTYYSYSKDRGESWTNPFKPKAFARKPNSFGGSSCCEVFPKYHKAGAKILGFGHILNYDSNNKIDKNKPRLLTFSMLNQETLQWAPPAEIELPSELKKTCNTIGFQIVELDNGDLLIPLAASSVPGMLFSVRVARVRIKKNKVEIIEYGRELAQVKQPRGLCEPSLIKFKNKFFMSLRNDITGYITLSENGVDFINPKPLCFDNGELVGNYNTQQRWIRNGDRELYLVYTRRNYNNNNVFRHRAPLLICKFDTDRLCLIRETEQIIVPNHGARLGNFMVHELSPHCSWLTVAEWMQNDTVGLGKAGAEYCTQFGSDNNVFLAEIEF